MRTRSICLVMVVLTLRSEAAVAQVGRAPQITRLSVVVARDSGGDAMTAISSIDLPSQRPWQNEFYLDIGLASLDSAKTAGLELLVSFELRMGPQLFGGPDGEVLLTQRIDSLGVWLRSPTVAAQAELCSSGCPREVRLGPFELEHLIPGPKGAEALLWPTRLRITAQALGVPRGRQPPPSSSSLQHSVASKVLSIE